MLGCQEYEKLVETMERRFGNNRMQEVYRNELKSRIQKQGKTLQELEADVRRLTYLAHSEYPSEVIENTVTNAFVDGIRDAELRMAVKINGKKASHEALAFALSMEAAKTSTQKSSWVKRTEIQEEDQSHLIRKIAEQVNSLNKQQTNSRFPEEDRRPRCFRCSRPGHMQRDSRDNSRQIQITELEKIAKSGKLEAADFRGRESDQQLKNAPIITTKNSRKRVITWS